MPPPAPLGVTVMPEWFQHEGVAPVLDRIAALDATAIATSPYVLEPAPDGEGAREPPPDGEAGRVRPLDRPLFGRTELWVRTAPAFAHDAARYAGLRYQPSPATALTTRHADLLDRVVAAARERGIAVYLQVMAASPPGYRVQFSGAVEADQCRTPDGTLHGARVDRNASLGSRDVQAYTAALVAELAARWPDVDGVRLDWPEYPPYDFASALFDFNAAMAPHFAAAGHDAAAVARDVRTWRDALVAAVRRSPGEDAATLGAVLDAHDFAAVLRADGALAPLWQAKRTAARALLAAVRAALDALPGPRRALEPQAFPPPFSAMSGFPIAALAGLADRVGIKLYTMHWPMIARYWARDIAGPTTPARQDALTAALALRFGFTDGLADGAHLRYPEPHEAHPVGAQAQRAKLAAARVAAGAVPVVAFVHSYGPLADVVGRFELARASGLPVWINRYGYLSDAKLAALAEARR
ncbi:MAG: hypothetical protein U1F10_00750 [Burkholderiales bacterium]